MAKVESRKVTAPQIRQSGTSKSAEPPAPTTIDQAQVPDLPRQHQLAQTVDRPKTLLGHLSATFQRHDRAVSAVMIGATALPAIAGVPTTAMAQTIEQVGKADQSIPADVEAEALASQILFGDAADHAKTPAQTSDASGDSISVGEQASLQAQMRGLLGNRRAPPAKISQGSIRIAGMHEALQRMLLERQFPPTTSMPQRGTPTHTDLGHVADAVRGMDVLLSSTNDLPGHLVGDLDQVTRAILDAKPGQVGDAIDQALKTAPSLDHMAPAATDAPQVPQTGSLNPGAVTAPQTPTAALKSLLASIPTGAAAQGTQTLGAYSAMVAPLDQLASLPLWNYTTSRPLQYDNGIGTVFRIPAGATFANSNGQLVLDAPSLLLQRDDLSLAAGHTTIKLGGGLDGFTTDSVSLATNGTDIDLTNATLGVDRDNGAALVTADEAFIDMASGSIHATGASLSLDPNGDLDATAATALLTQGNNSAWVEELTAHQSADGTTTASAGVLDADVGGTMVRAGELQLSIAGPVTTMTAGQVDIASGSMTASATNAALQVSNAADGSTAIRFAGDDVAFADGGGALSTVGRSTVSLEHRPDGSLAHASASAADLTWTDPRGTMHAQGGEIDLSYGDNGLLQSADASANHLDFEGDAGKLNADGGDLSLRYDDNGVLRRATASASHASYSGDRGDLSVDGGRLAMVLGPDGKTSRLTGTADVLDYTGADGLAIKSAGTTVDLRFSQDGNLSRATSTVGKLDAKLAGGDTVLVTDGAADLRFDADGNLRKASATAGSLDWTSTDGRVLSAGKSEIDATYDDAGLLSALSATSDDVEYSGPEGDVHATGGALDLIYEGGKLQQIKGSTEHLEVSAALGDIVADGPATLDVAYGESGSVQSVHATATHLSHSNGDRVLDVTGGVLDAQFGDDGVLDQITASAGSGTYEGEFGKLSIADGGSLAVQYTDGTLSAVNGQVGTLAFTGDEAKLDVTGGTVDASFGADGALESMKVHGDQIHVIGSATNGHDLDVAFNDVDAHVTVEADGSQTVNLSGQDGELNIDGHTVGLENVQKLEVQTGADGTIERLEADFPGALTFEQSGGDLKVTLQDAHAEIEQEGSRMMASFGEADVALVSEGLTAHITDASIESTDTQLRLHVGSAQVIKDLEKEMNVTVEGVDLVVDKTAEGAAKALDLQIAGLDAHVVGMDIIARTTNGERVRLHMEMDDAGSMVREAFLQIPEGGEIKIDKDDTHITLGEQQTFTFEQDAHGTMRLGAEGLNIEAVTKDAEVKVHGGSAAVSMNPNTGRLVIEHVHGTEIDIKAGDQKINIDIEKLDGFLVKMTGVSGAAQGAQLHLVPTSDGSTMTLEVHTKVKGIPVYLELDDVHELKLLGEISENEVHVYAGDPSGQGRIALGAGPLKFEGSAIEIFARYHSYDSERMLSSVGRFMSKEGLQITDGLTVEPDGVVRLGTTKPGLNAELAVLLPRGTGAPPAYLFEVGHHANDGAAGAVLSLGGRGITKSGTEYVGSVFLGAVPGSYLQWHQTQGTASFAGIPLPNEVKLGTTGVAGLSFERNQGPSRLSLDVGAFVNPVGMLPESLPLKEDVPYGAFGGLRYSHGDDFHAGVDALIDVPDGKPQLGGVRLTIGVRF